VPGTRLGDVFLAAKARGESKLRAFIQSRLSVRSDDLPDWYRVWFSMPWHRVYTVNIDDIELAVSRQFHLPRPIRAISATSGRVQGSESPTALEVVHLNGAVWDELDQMTFSALDYGGRLAVPDISYIQCATDLVSRPVVVVGTELDESPLWQYLESRRGRLRGQRELRPGSYLVTPTLNPARAVVLRELNVDLVQLTAKEFAQHGLLALGAASAAGHAALDASYQAEQRRSLPRLVSDLALEPAPPSSEYLSGHEPKWTDITSGRAIVREFDTDVYKAARSVLFSSLPASPLALTGTAGSGKSTSLMRLGLRLVAEGITTYWIDESSNIDPYMLRSAIARSLEPVAILIDDADVWGRTLSGWLRELPGLRPRVLLVAAMRSSKVEDLLDPEVLAGTTVRELSMPQLSDADIEALVRVLDGNNRLGVLKGKSHRERVEAFREERAAGRQLLVAMIQATSARPFREKAFAEFVELPVPQKLLYAIVCFVHARRFSLEREELLLALGRADNDALNAIEALTKRSLVVRDNLQSGYRARHRVVAEQVIQHPEFRPLIPEILDGVCFAFATRVSPVMRRTARPWRQLARFISHDFLLRAVDRDTGRGIYGRLEQVLPWDFHYWLQRGAYELELFNLDGATQFLDQARSLRPDDRYVEVEYGYLLVKKAIRIGTGEAAHELFDEGFALLEDVITRHGKLMAHPYDIAARQSLDWIAAAQLSHADARPLLEKVMRLLEDGVRNHPQGQTDLASLLERVKRTWLGTAVS
jgi:tetratricopeptide (TPR) repeat protein